MNVKGRYPSTEVSNQYAFDLAEKNGWEIVLPKMNELQIDIDSPEQEAVFLNQIARFGNTIAHVNDWTARPSKSGHPDKKHITVRLNRPVSDESRITFQLMLGSDTTREILSWSRMKAGEPHPTLFFELPQKKVDDASRYPHQCPRCGGPAYIGLFNTDCKRGCK